MGKRLITLIILIVGIAVLITGVALAEEGIIGGDEGVPPSDTVSTDTSVTEPPVTDPTDPPVTDVTEAEDETTDPTDVTVEESEHPENWGGIISDLRHSDDPASHAPAAAVMGKTVPGWEKNHPDVTIPEIPKPKHKP